jgi:hypothetical protein
MTIGPPLRVIEVVYDSTDSCIKVRKTIQTITSPLTFQLSLSREMAFTCWTFEEGNEVNLNNIDTQKLNLNKICA